MHEALTPYAVLTYKINRKAAERALSILRLTLIKSSFVTLKLPLLHFRLLATPSVS